jgi:hypothetical protein
MSDYIKTVTSETKIESTRNDHKYGVTKVWHTTVVTMVDFTKGQYAGRTYRDVMVFESTSEYGRGQVVGHYQDPVKLD